MLRVWIRVLLCGLGFVCLTAANSGGAGCLSGYEYAECSQGQTRDCLGPPPKGECKKGTQTCTETGKWGPCQGAITATAEVCDGKDNDCDGEIDNAEKGKSDKLQQECYDGPDGTDGKGVCKKGSQTCENGAFGACTGAVTPEAAETCGDGKDNNCNGQTDEDCVCDEGKTQPCGEDKGICTKGTQTCAGGKWGNCEGGTPPEKSETCNGKDDDCNGTVDDGTGLCTGGAECKNGKCETNTSKPTRTGTFEDSSIHKTTGTVAIYKDADGERIEISADFKTDNGPDLMVYLVEDPKGDASNSGYLSLGKLSSFSGAQTYKLPAGKTSAQYKSVSIWCEQFSVLFGHATLSP